MLDIDHFKQVNDTYGHPAGDLVLQSVASGLTSQLRRVDTLGRLGGEEFGVLLQDIDTTLVLDTAERLRRHIESVSAPHSPPIKVTASFGATVLDPEINSVHVWMALTDNLLYEAKTAGRNQCCLFKRTARQGR
jgi:diguanylate cyclase (GGDEF)-like protein